MKKIMILIFLIFLTGCQKEEISVVLNPGYDIVGINSEWVDEGCSLQIDNTTKDMTVHTNEVDLTSLGEYDVIYTIEYKDDEYICKRTVKVIDDVVPVVFLNSGIDTIILGENWVDAGITASDNLDNDLSIEIRGTVDTNVLGSYEITYIVRDNASNTTVVKRIVNVIEQGE